MMSMIISCESGRAGLFFGGTGRTQSMRRHKVFRRLSDFSDHDWEIMMPAQEQGRQPVDQDKQARQQRKAAIGQHVIRTLGQPGNLHGVQVRHLWEDHFRVNILVGLDAASAKVAHSFFLVADSDGNIVASTPKITRQY
jgi:hypothetical protein